MGHRRWGGLVQSKIQDDAEGQTYGGLETLEAGSRVTRAQFVDILRTIDKGLRALPATGQASASHRSLHLSSDLCADSQCGDKLQ